ncbi:MAG: DNA mismatch repair endonuclease MutL [Bacteroides sp.]|nr:DNA mismatch repair endonuclease MutL [Bacillota bacterium]MCM1393870.1 DNA mismatch repair endonuclease MutL [[Eubacterium] siraeum]MCM1455833.1 DNA mismatch repair endonuclease MutL [Bacteroides sp.]
MGKINILQPNVFNMLAAGEVVECPASVVKELVENSLDAGATEIDVYVQQGGIRKIQVSDNGIGILKEDMRSAFLPHATSKISEVDDLDSLATLGFRGEALASIASVSEVTLISASKAQGTAAKIVLSGGKVLSETADSRNQGTIITVENLFFNTPARLKFLKKPASEMRLITDTMRTLVLSNPSVSFTLSNEDGEILRHDAGTLADAVCAVYGAKTVDKLLEVKCENEGGIQVRGFVSSCDFTKPNRSYQTAIVNGRVVSDMTIQTAVERAYGDYLMKRAYPVFILEILMPFDEVDVNVHPRKSEVRFYDRQKVFGAVYRAVQDTVNASVGKSAFGFSKYETPEQITEKTAKTDETVRKDEPVSNSNAKAERIEQTKINTSALHKPAPINFPFSGKREFAFRESAASVLARDNAEPIISELPLLSVASDNAFDETNMPEQQDNLYAPIEVFDGKIIGQVFSTYLLVERDEKLYIIDQHAAHERILYDRIVEKCKPQYTQSLLIPYKLSLTGVEEEYIEKILPTLKSLGFEIERAGYTYLVSAVPEPVSQMSFSKFFGNLFANMLSEEELTLAELLKEKLCQQACKAAIKGGETLTRDQIEQVIKNYVDGEGNLPAKCPHGRPAVVALDKRDLEKMFKRIV